jgi:predicted transposase YbfD/YdcC
LTNICSQRGALRATINHGRIERREHWLMGVPEHLKRATKHWAKLQTIAMVRRTRQVGDKSSEEIHDYISSLPLSAGAQSVAHPIRSHWAVENALHCSGQLCITKCL